MRLATLRTGAQTTTAALAVGADAYLPLPARDAGALLRNPEWRSAARDAAAHASTSDVVHGATLAPLLPQAGKVICCGLNYGDHIQEMGRELPEYPTLFAKFADTLAGAADEIEVQGSERVDWEAELAVVVGATLTRADEAEAQAGIAGYTVANDVSMRDWQNRTLQWFQGKAFDATTPVGPVMATPDEVDGGDVEVRGYVNGELVQRGHTRTLVFGPARLLSYISQFTTLRPGDLVLTGTPGGVGMGMQPPRFLADGDIITTEIDGIGRLANRVSIRQPARHHQPVHSA
ncbi:fumarylacetoacetate hydrolase family protein [Arthrobacter sp. I2-34]|uniref:Fumarylacetoacetate hydrolase family protein n=1 Tax=Arthrobacter hankyongi TaxID=2904801 RepID=A0ABS9LB85_9MICC|nr:fumarylacetoacetate hydrolase family protein [Arthrobacter hankyongi]MCG2623942.1 fumarylacetoacetate hydrolase family protein [Arthrobacter hankyongi]